MYAASPQPNPPPLGEGDLRITGERSCSTRPASPMSASWPSSMPSWRRPSGTWARAAVCFCLERPRSPAASRPVPQPSARSMDLCAQPPRKPAPGRPRTCSTYQRMRTTASSRPCVSSSPPDRPMYRARCSERAPANPLRRPTGSGRSPVESPSSRAPPGESGPRSPRRSHVTEPMWSAWTFPRREHRWRRSSTRFTERRFR